MPIVSLAGTEAQVTESYLLGYVFATFVVGTVCVGAGLVLARLRQDELARAFLLFYLPLSVLVLAGLLLTFVETVSATSSAWVGALRYLESFVGRYGVMIGLPLFAHRVFDVRWRGSDAILTGVVVVTFGAQHLTEFVLGGAWDARGDLAEDVAFAAVVVYTLWVGSVRLDRNGVYEPLGRRFIALLVVGLPAIGHDLFVLDGPGLRLYPLWYCATGLVLILTLIRRRSMTNTPIPPTWDLTPREEEIVRLVQRGLSNREIARHLTISPNTVKTHLQATFDKSGFHSRIALIAALAASGGGPGAPDAGGGG